MIAELLDSIHIASNSSEVAENMDQTRASESPYEKTLVFFVINIIISLIFYLLYCGVLKYKVGDRGSHVGDIDAGDAESTSNTSSASRDSLRSIKSAKSPDRALDWISISTYLLIAATAFLWYSISLTFTIYNKWILQVLFGGFRFPVLNTSIHMIIKYLFSRLYTTYVIKLENIPEITKGLFWKVVVPIGITTSFDIAFSNEAISHISISLYTIIKTTVVVWTFLWGCLFDVEVFSVAKFNCIVLVIVGLSITVLEDLDSSFIGILYCLLAAMSGGLRWVLVQVLCDCDPSCKHPIVSMFRFSGSTVLTILPLAVVSELKDFIDSPFNSNNFKIYEIGGVVCLGGFIACLLIIVEIYLLTLTSSLTLSLLGEMKEIVQILFAMFVFHDHISIQTCLGLLVVLLSAELYRHTKNSESNSESGRKRVSDRPHHKIDSYMPNSTSQIHKGHLYKAVPVGSGNNDQDRDFELSDISNIESS